MINEIILGGLIYHMMYTPTLPFPAVITRPTLILKSDTHINYMIGKNSINEAMAGIGYDIQIASHPTLGNINLKTGFYIQDENKFEDLGIITPLGCDIMPIFGFEFNIPYNDVFGATTTITPAITFTGIYFRF